MTRICIDASVLGRWLLQGGSGAEQAQALMQAVSSGAAAFAPDLIYSETANLLLTAHRAGHLPEPLLLQMVDAVSDLAIRSVPTAAIMEETMMLSRYHDLSAYDAAYVAVAERTDSTLVTADQTLYEATAEERGTRWLAEWSSG